MKFYQDGTVYADNALIGVHKETIEDLLTLTDERGTYAPFAIGNIPATFKPFTQETYFRFAEWCHECSAWFYVGVVGIEPHWTIPMRPGILSTEELFQLFIDEINV